MCDAVAEQQQQQSEKNQNQTGFCGPFAARRNEAGRSMGLAQWAFLSATASQRRRGGHDNSRNNS